MPSQNRVGGDKAGHALQAGATQTVTQDGESATLVIGQTERPAAELGPERPVLLEEVVQSGRLAPVEPGGQGEVEPAERRRITHAVENSRISPVIGLGRLMGHYGLEFEENPGAGLEKIQRVIINAAYRVHAGIEAKAEGSRKLHHQSGPIVETVFRSEAGNPVAAAIKEAPTGGGVGPESTGAKFHP